MERVLAFTTTGVMSPSLVHDLKIILHRHRYAVDIAVTGNTYTLKAYTE